MAKHTAAEDAAELSRLGYAQELFRNMGGFSNFALSFSLISIITGITQLYGYGLSMGGPFEMLAGWPIVTLFSLTVAMSMGEMASAFPTSGAMYHWSCKLGGAGWGWLTAWLNLIGLVTLLAAVDWGCARFVVPLVGLAPNVRNQLLVYALLLFSHGIINHCGIRLVAWLNDFSVTVHIVGVAALIGGLALLASHQPASFLLLRESRSPDAPALYPLAFIVGLLQAQWTMTGYDASAQVTEETVEPRIRVPWGMVMAVAVSGFFGYLFVLALTVSIPHVAHVLQDQDTAALTVLSDALGARVGEVMAFVVIGAAWFCGLSSVTSVSRALYAFSRDGGVPMAGWWRRVSPRFGTPSRAIWLCVTVAFLAAVYTEALNAIISISVVAINLSYILPVILDWRHEKWGGEVLRGPWNLGRWSRAVHAVAITWVGFITVVLIMPPNALTGKVLGGVLALLGVYYLAIERHRFRGPDFLRPTAEPEREPVGV